MSKISDIYDSLTSLVDTALVDYVKIPNPYAADENAEIILTKAYGIAVGPGSNSQRSVSCVKSYVREFTIPIINQITATDHDIEGHALLEKSILEDRELVFNALEEDPDLNNTSKTIQLSDGGIEFLEGDRAKYLLIEVLVECEYFNSN